MPNDTAVSCNNLCKMFGSFCAVDNLTFEVKRGQIFGFLGPNGSGKSTTIRMLCGLITPSSGSALVGGFNITHEAEIVRRNIGYVSQKFSLYEDLTVLENLQFYSGIYGLRGAERIERIEEGLERIDLTEQRNLFVKDLSMGVRQRLSLAAALMHHPPILFLDEPTSGVDPISRRRFWELIYELAAQGVTILITTHYMDEAEHCNRIVMIRDGKLVGNDTPAGLKKSLMPGPVILIRCDKPYEAMSVLSSLPIVHDVSLYGRSLHAAVTGNKGAVEAITAALNSAGIVIEEIVPTETTLEDVFIAISSKGSEV